MSAMEKSDLPEVARKRANKAASAAAEPVERRGGVLLFGTDQRITSGPAAKRLRSKAEYMAAPERFAQSQIPLAPRAPSSRPIAGFPIDGLDRFASMPFITPAVREHTYLPTTSHCRAP